MKKLSIIKGKKKGQVIECAQRQKELTATVSSQSDLSKEYKVRYENQEGKLAWSCTCLAYTYRKPGVVACKHITSVKNGMCWWKSTVGPEEQKIKGRCPRCQGPTVQGRSSS